MSLGDFKASRNALIAELRLLIIGVSESGLDEHTADLVIDKATSLMRRADDSVTERELDKLRTPQGRLQDVAHEAARHQTLMQISVLVQRGESRKTGRPRDY